MPLQKMVALKGPISGDGYGRANEGDVFEVDEEHAEILEAGGLACRHFEPKPWKPPVAGKAMESPENKAITGQENKKRK